MLLPTRGRSDDPEYAARFAFVAPATFRIAREIAATRVSAPSAPR